MHGTAKENHPAGKTTDNRLGLVFLCITLAVLIAVCAVLLMRNEEEPISPVLPVETKTPVLISPTVKPLAVRSEALLNLAEPLYDLPTGLHSGCVILIDTKSGAVLAEKEADRLTFPASITKMMTVLVAIENIADPKLQTATLTSEMIQFLWEQGASQAGFQAGERVCALDLMYGALLPSGADACLGLAQIVAGSEEGFVSLMNEKALQLGMTYTHFVNTTGLHNADHYTTVRDLAKLVSYAMQNPLFRTIATTRTYTTSATNIHPYGITFSSSVFASIQNSGLANPGIIGGKTGFTPEAGQCLTTIAVINGREYALITTGAGNGTNTGSLNVADAVSIYEMLKAENAAAA